MAVDQRPLVLHVVYRLDVGGLENGVVNLINQMPADAYRHAVLSLTEIAPAFAARIQRDDVDLIALHKPPGQGFWFYPKVIRLLRRLRPAIVHTRNLAALEMVVPAWLVGVPVRIHSEHGRDLADLRSGSRRFDRLRRIYRPFVSHYVALSQDLADYLVDKVGVSVDRLTQIRNGVDTVQFAPRYARPDVAGWPFSGANHWCLGTVGRMQVIKDQLSLARAFVQVIGRRPDLRDRLRLVVVGDGPQRASVQAVLDQGGVADLCWLPGERGDVADILGRLDCFVLPSLSEGFSNVILEAMACALPVIATDVGGNAELVQGGITGEVVPPAAYEALADSLMRLALDPSQAARMGRAGRAEVEKRYSLTAMVRSYQCLYDRLRTGVSVAGAVAG